MNQSENSEKIIFVLLGVLGVVAAFVGLGMVANRTACGAWATPESVPGLLRFFNGADTSAFGTTATGCHAPLWHLIVWSLGIIFVLVAVVMAFFIIRSRYRQSDRYLINQLRVREGIARAPEIRRSVGPRAGRKAVKKVRPTLKSQPADRERGLKSGRRRAKDPTEANFWLGRSQFERVYASLEDSMLLLGPPRSGKGVGVLVGAIIDAPGPVITTSSRADNLAMTMHKRAEKGPVAVFDPQGLSGQKTNFKWSPISGCEDPLIAEQRATSLIHSAGLDPGSSNAEWAAPAITIMECLLHAAALGDPDTKKPGTIDDLMSWGTSDSEAKTAVKWLERHESKKRAAVGWAAALDKSVEEDPKLRGNLWFGVRNAVKGLAVPNVRAALQPMSEAETFDIDNFLDNNGTLYVIGTKTGGASVGPFLIAMMDAITEHARQKAAKRDSNRLDPPLALILDEIANIATAWPGLISLMSDGGGVGISPFPVFQSLAQVEKEWGAASMKALWEAATIKLQLGGAADTDTLGTIQTIAGTYEHRRNTKSYGQGGVSTQEQFTDKNVLEQAEIRRLPTVESPMGPYALMFYRRARPILLKVRPYFKRKDAKEIDKNKKRYYTENRINEDTGQAHGWKNDPRNKEQPLPTSTGRVHRQASSVETPAETKQRLADEANARNVDAMQSIDGWSWDEQTGTLSRDEEHETTGSTANVTAAEDQENQTSTRRGVLWG